MRPAFSGSMVNTIGVELGEGANVGEGREAIVALGAIVAVGRRVGVGGAIKFGALQATNRVEKNIRSTNALWFMLTPA